TAVVGTVALLGTGAEYWGQVPPGGTGSITRLGRQRGGPDRPPEGPREEVVGLPVSAGRAPPGHRVPQPPREDLGGEAPRRDQGPHGQPPGGPPRGGPAGDPRFRRPHQRTRDPVPPPLAGDVHPR